MRDIDFDVSGDKSLRGLKWDIIMEGEWKRAVNISVIMININWENYNETK